MFDKVAIAGTGLIGGSIGLALLASGAARKVVGYDPDLEVLGEGLARGAFSAPEPDVAKVALGAELVVIAAPVDVCADVGSRLRPGLADDAVVTDVGSAKARVVASCEALLGPRFIGGHPMAGSERHGIAAASADLFQDASWILTPTSATTSHAYRKASALAVALGARPVAVEPSDHDRLLARLSHLPQLTASAIVAAATAAGGDHALLGLAAGGFRDVTRIAASDPALWVAILRANREAVLEALSDFGTRLDRLVELLESDRWDELRSVLADAQRARRELFAKPLMHDVPVALSMAVLDRPGVLAEVTTAAGSLGANIEDLRIVHSPEGGRGRLELVIAGEEPATRLTAALESLGYRVQRGRPD